MPTEKLGIEIESIAKDIANLKGMVQDLKDIQTAAGGATQKMSDFQRQVEQTRSLRETFQSMSRIGLEMMAISGGILYGFKKVGMGMLDAALETEKYELTLRTLFKSAKQAKEELKWAEEFEEITPYSLKDIIAADVVMRSFGLDARKYLGMAGDMAAVYGGDAATLQSVVTGVSRAMTAGSSGMDILTKSFAIGTREIKKFGWKGQAEDIEGFRRALEKLLVTRYAGGMRDLQKTLPAIMEGFKSEWFKIRKMIGEPLVAKILPDVTKVYDELVKLRKAGKLDEWAKIIKDLFVGIYQAIKGATAFAWKFLKPIMEFLKKHPEFAKIAGQIAFYGSAFGLATGAALHFTSQIGLTIIGVNTLIKSLGGLGAMNLFVLRRSLSAVNLSLGGILGLAGQIGLAFATGWALGNFLRELKIGQKTLGQMLDDILKTKRELELEKAAEKGVYTETIIKNIREVRSTLQEFSVETKLTKPEFSIIKSRAALSIPNLVIPWESLSNVQEALSYLDKAELLYVNLLKEEKLLQKDISVEKITQWKTLEEMLRKQIPFTKAQQHEYEILLEQFKTIEEGRYKYLIGFEPEILPWHKEFIEQYKKLEAQMFGLEKLKPELRLEIELEYTKLRKQLETIMDGKYKSLIKYKPEIITPTPADLGITPPTDIYATARPQIDNYYYTIHFERDSVQINTLDLTPEKFQRLLFEFFKRQSLAPQ